MDLYDYYYQQKKESNMTLPDFSAIVGLTPCMISLIMHGHRFPSFQAGRRIEIATHDKVKFLDMMKFYYERRRAKDEPLKKEKRGRKRIIREPAKV